MSVSLFQLLLRRIDELEQHVVDLYRHKEEIDRRVHNMNRPARVVELGKDKDGKLDGTAKVAYGLDENGEDVISPFIPWITRAGDLIKVWAPPAIGEQVRLQSPSGDIGTHSWIELGGFQVPDDQQGQNSGGGPGANQSNPQLFKQNHNEEEQHKLTIGKFSVLYKDGNVVFVSSYNASATPLQQGNKQQDAPPGIIQFYSGDDGSSVPQAPKKSIHLTQGSKDGSIVAQATGDQGVITVLAQGSQGSIALLAPNGNGAVSVLAAKTV
ncbi:MAG TPA: hypothetical protein VE986_00250, partial [Hyphomicrobiales bacterium]|nr:hypothetical protein [Hyphomicrobiales bacterium]